jgi:hypothetical protein
MGINVLMLLVLASVGLVVSTDVPQMLKHIVLIAYAGLAIYIAVVAAKPRWLVSRPIFDVLLSAGVGGHLRSMAVRMPHILTLMVFTWTSLAAFGVVVPIGKAILCLPIVYFVAVLPISFQGLGTSNFMFIHFFAAYAPGTTHEARQAVVLAATLVAQAVAFAVQLSVGLLCMRSQLARGLGRTKEPEAAAEKGVP